MSKAATAILVKSRAKYGRRLVARDYDELLSCKNVSDIVAYLRTNTHYNVSLDGIREAAVHRGNLEQLLKSKIYNDFAELCKFERSIGEHYFEYLMMKNEIDRLLVFLRYFTAGYPEKYLFALPDFFSKNSKIDFVGITESKSFDDILNHLKRTDYYSLLSPFQTNDGTFDFTTAESVLDRYLYQQTEKMIDKNFSGKEKQELKRLFATSAELDNIRKIYRAKEYFGVSETMLKAQLNDMRALLNKTQYNSLISCESAAEVIDILKKTKYKFEIEKCEFSFIDELANRVKFDFFRREMCFSSYAAVVMAATIFIFEIEIENITNIIEGKRYGVDNELIKKMLILERVVK